MKRIVALIMAVVISICITACNSDTDKSKSTVEQYKNVAQEYIDKGDIETAKKALEEGIALTNDEGLKKMLEEISTVDEVKEESADVSSPEAEALPDVESVSILSQLNGEEVKKLNMFLSNFSEAQFEDYSQDAYSNAQLIRYSFIHNFINNDSKIQWTESSMGISSVDVNNDTQRFFGKVVPLESTGDWNYANGTFYRRRDAI